MNRINDNRFSSPVRPNEAFLKTIDLPGSGAAKVEVIHCQTIEALIQEAGKFKYISNGPVYFRGQRELYGAGIPLASIYRNGNSSSTAVSELDRLLIHLSGTSARSWNELAYGECCEDHDLVPKDMPFHDIPLHSLEGLLQHYGVRTRWLDITDSIPHAIFFGLVQYGTVSLTNTDIAYGYDPKTKGSCCSRVMNNQLAFLNRHPEENENCYIMAICIGELQKRQSKHKGLRNFENGLVLDVRESVPSQYLRPHMQHGLLYKANIEQLNVGNDKPSNIRIFELPSRSALEWLGSGKMFTPESIYPPIRKITSLPPTSNATEIVDKGLSEIEQTIIHIRNECTSDIDSHASVYKPLTQVTNFVTLDALYEDIRFDKANIKGKPRIDWKLP